MKALLKKLYHDESGATAVEYAIIAALVGVASIGAVKVFGGELGQMFQDAADQIRDR
jgi:pilus assembly protein Flp/PilA